jgi:hypothetical protein
MKAPTFEELNLIILEAIIDHLADKAPDRTLTARNIIRTEMMLIEQNMLKAAE